MKLAQIFSRIFHYIDLESELDHFDKIHETIKKELVFKGTNLWILAFAIIIASVGLNINSTAVIIGAMLISPLMGPINGMGYSIATYNLSLFMQSLKNFAFAVIASLIASTGYFFISPISTAHSELLARISPTIYDVLIALFGGLAGIIAISSKIKGNVIPGVAIATALMPPLCTAGYGLATAQFHYFFGAIFLFIINTVFIALSSVIISQILKFPIRTLVGDEHKRRVNRWITFVIMMVLIPSIYFGNVLVQHEKFTEKASRFISTINIVEGNYLLKNEIDPKTKTIALIYGGLAMDEKQKNLIIEKARIFALENAQIMIQQGFSIEQVTRNNTDAENLTSEINRLSLLLKEKEQQIETLTHKNDIGKQLLSEIRILYPSVKTFTYAESDIFNDSISASQKVHLIVLKVEGRHVLLSEKKQIEDWLKIRLKSENIKIFLEY